PPRAYGNHRVPSSSAAERDGAPKPMLPNDTSHHCRTKVALSAVTIPFAVSAHELTDRPPSKRSTTSLENQYANGLLGTLSRLRRSFLNHRGSSYCLRRAR